MKVMCKCPCHHDPSFKHFVPCCDGGFIEMPDLALGRDPDDKFNAIQDDWKKVAEYWKEKYTELLLSVNRPHEQQQGDWDDAYNVMQAGSYPVGWCIIKKTDIKC